MAMKVTSCLSFTRPDDWHLHLRDGAAMQAVLSATARRFGRAIIMPNLRPPITTVLGAQNYRVRIIQALHETSSEVRFEPLMTLYLTDDTPPDEIDLAIESGAVNGVKLYPAGATTNSDSGVTDINKVNHVLARMEEVRMPLLVHGEVTDPTVDIFDREAVFIDRVLTPLRKRFPGLRIIFEHITTEQAVNYVLAQDDNVAATITAHHLVLNRNAIFAGGVRPHHYCLPVLKREAHRQALIRAATSGNRKFFLGTDSAPHARNTKEVACGCAGCYTAHAAIELYAEVFEEANALDKLEAFASFNGPDFYKLPRNRDMITLVQEPWTVPATYPFGDDVVVPLRAGEVINWRVVD